MSVTNLTWLTMQGNSSSLPEVTSRIVCSWPAGFVFTKITELHISALGFLSCGHNDSAAVSVMLLQQSDISNCMFQNSTNNNDEGAALCYNSPFKFQNSKAIDDGGVLYIESSNLTLKRNIFRNNSVICGGALGVWKSNVIITGNIFQSNSALFGNVSVDGVGGALSASHSTLTLTGNKFQSNSVSTDCCKYLCAGALYVWLSYINLTENLFQSNSAPYGGAVTVLNGSLTLTGNTFQSNFATSFGGALYVEYSIGNLKNNTFQNNNSASYGGAGSVYSSTLNLTGNTFQSNFATCFGGALYVDNSIGNLKNNVFQNNNSSPYGGAVSILNSTFNLVGNTFKLNLKLARIGGALFLQNNINLSVTENIFWKNSAREGGALAVITSILDVTNNTFKSNSANIGGALSIDTCNLSITGNKIWSNSAHRGGALAAVSSTLNLIMNIFQSNFASERGGAVYIHAFTDMTSADNLFNDSSAQLGGAILVFGNSTVRMYGQSIITKNTALYGGGIAALGSQLELIGSTIFDSNTAVYGGGLYAYSTGINGKATVTSNSAAAGGGGVYAARSVFHFKGNTTVMKNLAMGGDGGGLLLSDESKFYLQPDTHVCFISNSANGTGGGIKIEEHNPLTYCISIADVSSSDCFFQIENETEHWLNKSVAEIIKELNIGIYFDNNIAIEAGADLHGGSIDNCSVSNINTGNSRDIFNNITSSTKDNTLDISSDPLHICTCRLNVTDCSSSYFPEPVYPGGTLEVPVIACGQRNGTTAAVIQVVNTPSIFQGTESIQNTSKNGSTLRYTIPSNSTRNIFLYAKGPCPPTIMNTLNVVVSILPCPPGFDLSQSQQICICAERLYKRFTSTCLIENQTVLRAQGSEFWVGYSHDNMSRDRGLILNPHCPFDYCTSEEMYLLVEDSDKQCNYNRSGLLCGNCSDNLSLVLGSSRCLPCSYSYFALLPAFAFAGIALVLLLLVLRLTVATGTINGLIFYANIVAVNSAIFFRPKVTNVLTVFIAWLNLDLGIETCFYNGLDAYVKTWLQFVFPLYVWALVGIIIIGSHFSGRIARTFGKNPVAVLATLFLLSYAKLLRTAFAALSYTTLEYPNREQIVWRYDGNIRYLSRKHTPLLIAAMVCLIFLFLPYTMLLIFSQCLQSKSMYKVFSWVNSLKIKPFLDAYHAPYTNKHRYWTGVMLLLRFVLFLISAFPFNRLGDPSVNLLAIVSASTALLTFLAMLGTRVYKNWCLSLLELSFLLNLAILAAATLYIRPIVATSGGNQNAATFTSVGIAFMTFVGIIIYHSVQQTKGTWLYKRVSRCLRRNYVPVPANDQDPPDVGYVPGPAPTHTVVDIQDREACTTTN